jgi:hypothetical protein
MSERKKNIMALVALVIAFSLSVEFDLYFPHWFWTHQLFQGICILAFMATMKNRGWLPKRRHLKRYWPVPR